VPWLRAALSCTPKTSIGDLGWVAEFEDSEGNIIALHSPA
jgi:predicted enzyme related to lactoylglutathione lyase